MILQRILQVTVVSAFAFASAAFANSGTAPAPKQNVLVVKTPVDKTTGQPVQQGSKIQTMNIPLHTDSQGKVDVQQMADDAKAQLDDSQGTQIEPNQYDATQLPAKVKQKFDQAGQGSGHSELLNWSWYYYYPSYNYGWYGYGYYPYTYYYNSYYPYYGYYDSYYNTLYDYYYGYNNYDSNWYYTYYYWY